MLPTPPATAYRALALNAISLYLTAYLATILLHELGHALMSLALGGRPILYNTSVQNGNKHLASSALVLIAAAGPVLSLLQGASLLVGLRRWPLVGLWGLFWLYLAVFGLVNFLGYLLIAPFVKGGDTGQIVALLHVPAAVQWTVAGLSLYVLIKIIGGTAPLFLRLLPLAVQAEAGARTAALRALIGWPWLVGSVVLVLLALPAPHPAVVANMFMSPMVLRRTYANALSLSPVPAANAGLLRWHWLPVLASLGVALGFKLLAHGVAW
jgi:hypothetical protein